MLIGYNTNVPYKGKMYHVQTEDSGLNNPHIITLLYHQGAILRSTKTGYSELVGSVDFEEQLRDLMKRQHREMIRGLITGKFEPEQAEVTPKVEARPEQKEDTKPEAEANSDDKDEKKEQGRSLDEILLEHISRKVKE